MPRQIECGITQTYYGRIIKEARRRNIDISVDLEHLRKQFDAQGHRCVYTGTLLEALGGGVFTYSLDRIDSRIGYHEGNLQFVYKLINSMKRTMSDAYFLFAIQSIVENVPIAISLPENLYSTTHRPNFKGSGAVTGEVFGLIRSSAKRRGIEFDITVEQISNQFILQNGLCAYTSWSLRFPDYTNSITGTASVDRIDSNRGYVEDNILIVHKDINFMKLTHTESEFFKIITDIYNWSIRLGQPNSNNNKNKGEIHFV